LSVARAHKLALELEALKAVKAKTGKLRARRNVFSAAKETPWSGNSTFEFNLEA